MLSKNIWVAAGDGDLDRVQILLESDPTLSPNIPDDNAYTPMHAAASYGHLNVLEYLISRGGDVNVEDDDGDTPLYTVEDIATAEWLVNHGATIDHRNREGVTVSQSQLMGSISLQVLQPIQHLSEDFPAVANYLLSHTPSTPTGVISSLPTNPIPPPTIPLEPINPSQYVQEQVSNTLTTSLIQDVTVIANEAEREGRDIDEEALRAAVSRAVMGGVLTGFDMAESQSDPSDPRADGIIDGVATKRQREE